MLSSILEFFGIYFHKKDRIYLNLVNGESMMSTGDISNIFGFLGGLGMFLYGMSIMADGMQKTAGSRMSSFLGMLTNNRLLAVLLGALITAIIQSSGATTVMVVGFVSAGVLNLSQAVGVIMGANIGTTITAWIVSMSQLGDAFEIMKPGFYAPLMIGIGALLLVFAKSQKKKTIGEIMRTRPFVYGSGFYVWLHWAVYECPDLCRCLCSPWRKSAVGNGNRRFGDSGFAKLLCIGGNFADPGYEWDCHHQCRHLYNPGAEYRFLCHSYAVQCGRFPDGKTGSGYAPDL